MIVSSRNIILVFFCFFLITAHCQIHQPNRYEKEQKFNDDDFIIIPLQSEGLSLIREKNKFKSGNQFWDIVLLDTALQETGTLELEIDTDNHFIGYETSPGYVHFLFVKSQIKGEIDLISIAIGSKEILYYEIRPELNFQLTHFSKVGPNFVFGGYVNMESAVLLYNPSNNNVKIVPGFFQKKAQLFDIRANSNQTFNTVLVIGEERNNSTVIFRTFDHTGKQILETITTIDEDIVLQNGISNTLERDDLIVIGTWSRRTSRQAYGLYTLGVNPFVPQKVNHIFFGQLDHYLDYLKPKKAAKIKAKTLEAIETGKYPEFTNYLKPYKIVEHKGGYLLFAESYTPAGSTTRYNPYTPYNQYGTYPYPYTMPYGSISPTNRLYTPATAYGTNVVSDEEIKTIQSVVVAFDREGKPVWDYNMKIENVKGSTLEQIGDISLSEKYLHLLYCKEAELKVKKVNLSEDEIIEFTENIKLKDVGEELRSEGNGNIKHWFGANFYVWGHQSVRDKEGKTREVFYINKVVVY